MAWRFGIASDIGGREEQQDRVEVITSERSGDCLIVLADGMGGHDGGALAAQAVIDSSRQLFEAASDSDPLSSLQDHCLQAHQAVAGIGEREKASAGSTCVMLYLSSDEAYWAHVGDSRLYHYRKGTLLRRTLDHSLVQLMVSNGEMAEADMTSSPLQNQLYMRLGGNNEPKPELGATDVQAGDAFVLCSDGLWESVGETEIGAILSEDDLEGAVAQLAQLAKERGGMEGDNITVAIAQMGRVRRKFSWFK